MAWTEYRYQSQNPNQFESAGSIRLHRDDANVKKKPAVVVFKLVCMLGMLVIGFLIVMPSLPLPPLQSFAIAAGVLMIYVGAAYFVRPEPNTDNLGGMFGRDDLTQRNDDINRSLVSLHQFLGPGRFVSETLIDAATLAGLLPETTQEAIDRQEAEKTATAAESRRQEIEERVAEQQGQREHKGEVQLASLRFMTNTPDQADQLDQEAETS